MAAIDSSCFLEHKLRQNSRAITGTLLAILIMLSDASVSFATRFQLNPENTQTQNPECNMDCSNQRPKPFCGTDGRTYLSKCEVKKARCQGWNVRKEHNGPCAVELTKCQLERAQNLQQPDSSSLFVPQCNEDGSYAMIQCHKSFGYCWCVTEEGKPIAGSSVREGNPTCNRQADEPIVDNPPTFKGTSSSSGGSRCRQDKREEFNKNLKRIFKEEYARLPRADIAPIPFSSSRATLEWEKQVIEWKFGSLDENEDANLDSKELKPLLRLMKKIIKPKVCAKDFVKICDLDADDRLTEMEWSLCLGVDNNEQPEEPTVDSGGPQDGRSSTNEHLFLSFLISTASPPLLVTRQIPHGDNADSDNQNVPVLSCETERLRALEEQERTSASVVFVPQCTITGDYMAVQCHEQMQYCWCVYVDTGKPIPGTSVRDSTKEDCSPLATSRGPITPRVFVDCPDDKKKRFLIKLIEKLYAEMTVTDALLIETTTQAAEDLSPNHKDESIVWKFGQLDRNGNNYLEAKETATFATEIDLIKSSKKCRNNFLDFCDANQDSRLALKEWLHCFDITPPVATEAPPRRGRNPFIDRLT
ncbi:SPARC-related modular calcium-binding protein 1 isoform X2 [Strongylocentrotus purpuratus]|uniref:SPARC-related modular calcium-binding protein 1 n=1 Tax=Strongylocentrotus purpuratus TaxID=7668 RepID=A0A7M7PUE8_STRPU|nr:SPARC-related modular calcium-binding protein 1 isoform X2 [Strongylocentrotus purpuratus]